ncbi:MAG: hypothetical protein IPH43_06580 [Xanthomonadales bacterium]|nr:hypothetical protein [Xanthomonadales bacterium]
MDEYVGLCFAWREGCSINWVVLGTLLTGLGAIGSAGAAFAATYGAHQAKRAADAALEIDANQARRTTERERRDAIPLAIAIELELTRVEAHLIAHNETLRSLRMFRSLESSDLSVASSLKF